MSTSTHTSQADGIAMSGASATAELLRLTGLEKLLLVIPLLGGLFFGLMPLLAPQLFAQISQATGDDAYIYRLAGAATFGYAVALIMAIRQGEWLRERIDS